MTYKRFVQIGRVCLINYGPDIGKLCTIVDVIDINRVLVEGPLESTGVHRQQIPLKRISLTEYLLPIARTAGPTAVARALKDKDILTKWAQSSWSKKLSQRATRANMNDFDRFNSMIARKQKSRVVARAMAKVRREKL